MNRELSHRLNRLERLSRNVIKASVFVTVRLCSLVHQKVATRILTAYFRSQGMRITGKPNYIAATAWIDGTDYNSIELGEGCTLSSHVRILTHDWALHTAVRGLGVEPDHVLGHVRPVRIGRYVFIGMNSIVLPGTVIGDGCIVGAGSVVRGTIPGNTVVAGTPAKPIANLATYVTRQLQDLGEAELLNDLEGKLRQCTESQADCL